MIKKRLKNISLQTKLTVLIFGLFLMIIIFLGSMFDSILRKSVEEQIGKRALSVAETVATMPSVHAAFGTTNPDIILQPLAEEMRIKSGAEFIVIGNLDGIRYSHPNPERLGEMMQGGDNSLALEKGSSYISQAEGTLGPSIRGKVPLLNEEGEIIGIVSVGFLTGEVFHIMEQHESKIIHFIFVFLCISMVGAHLIAREVKRTIFGFEPHEIGRLYEERNAILQSIHEGIIAIDNHGYISTINEAAYNILNLEPIERMNTVHILDVLPNSRLLEVLKEKKVQFNQELSNGNDEIIASRIPVTSNGKTIGVVASFRKKTDIEQLSKELSQIQQYADMLRAQTHEYSNKLYTISGLIQLESYSEALEVINRESKDYQELIRFLLEAVPDKLLSAILLGKYTRAHELHVNFTIHHESSLRDLPTTIQQEKLVTILGNLLDNAFEAVLEAPSKSKDVTLFMTDLGPDYIFEIDDAGLGMPTEGDSRLFTRGYSTKIGEDRGHGLFLVKQAVDYLNGYMLINESELGGLSIMVVIPKNGG